MGIFDIFGDVIKLTESDNLTKTTESGNVNMLNDVDMSKVTKEQLDDTMNFLDDLKNNSFVTLLLGDEYIDKFKEVIQTSWDMTHEAPEPESKAESNLELPTSPHVDNTVESQIDKLVDEYMDSLDIPDDPLMNKLTPMAKESYKKFAEFIYNHE